MNKKTMNRLSPKISFIIMLLSAATSLMSQAQTNEVIVSCGGEYTNPLINWSYSMGEFMIETYDNKNIILTQGYHQVSYSITSMTEDRQNNDEIKIYPNPASSYFYCEIENFKSYKGIKAKLVDLNGKVILMHEFESDRQKIDISILKNSIYIFILYDNKGRIAGKYKIVKKPN